MVLLFPCSADLNARTLFPPSPRHLTDPMAEGSLWERPWPSLGWAVAGLQLSLALRVELYWLPTHAHAPSEVALTAHVHIGKLRLREVKTLAQVCPADKWEKLRLKLSSMRFPFNCSFSFPEAVPAVISLGIVWELFRRQVLITWV